MKTTGAAADTPFVVWDRAGNREVEEKVYGGAALRRLYLSACGRFFADAVLSRRSMSILAGKYWSWPGSVRRIDPFVDTYGIPMEEFEKADYVSFNDFFIRRFRPGARTFCTEPTFLPAFAEGRYLAFERVGPGMEIPVKGVDLDAATILGDPQQAVPFREGPALVARLCPVDYHRYHYPDDGTTVSSYQVHGRLHSVNPVALGAREGILAGNQRRVSLLETASFGRVAYVEVGAMFVGRIVQTHPENRTFLRGEEKGCFLFGGSTVILFGERGRWLPDEDLLSHTGSGLETLVRLGERVASRT